MNAIANLCPDHAELEAYLLGDVDLAADEAIDAHLHDCMPCQMALDKLDAAINQPFACLRAAAPGSLATGEEATYRRLVAQAKAIGGAPCVLQPAPAEVGLAGEIFGNYHLHEAIGSGGMGQVFKATHLRLKKTVAVKLIAPQFVRSLEGRRRFQVEMEAVGRLASPHIVAAHDAGEANGRDFLVMEYVEGSNLADLVQRQGPLPIAQALAYVLQAARGLEHAHAAGIIHRDVKPSNLLVSQRGDIVKVLDLGLARLRLDEGEALPAGSTGTAIMGTAAFMAPEQARDTHAADERADIYSLGCTLFFLCAGKPPYHGKSTMDVILAHREQPTPSLAQLRGDCPLPVDGFFRRLVAKLPQDRPASMHAVIEELERLTAGVSSPKDVRKPAPRHRSRRLGMIAVGGAAAVSVAIVIMLSLLAAGENPGVQKKDEPKDRIAAAPEPKGRSPRIDMVRIPAGEFWMGASETDDAGRPAEKPRRKVKLNQAFFLGKTEVTQAQYEEVMGNNPSAFSAKGLYRKRVKDIDTRRHPVESVSWLDAVRFCNRLSERHELEPYYRIKDEVVTIAGGNGYRLPTEAEWEYACRGGATTTWHFGENIADLKDHAWYAANSGDRTHPVGEKKANPFGLYDMYGNVPEWCWDRYDPEYYQRMPASDPPGSGTGRLRVFRGDGWNSRSPRTPAREALGFTYGSEGSINIIGIRLARNAE